MPVTVLHLDKLQVVAARTVEKDGYNAVQLGWGTAKVKNVSKPNKGHYARAKVEPKAKLVEFRVGGGRPAGARRNADGGAYHRGAEGRCLRHHQGQGFWRGSMKRWNFSGLEAEPRRVDQPSQPWLDR